MKSVVLQLGKVRMGREMLVGSRAQWESNLVIVPPQYPHTNLPVPPSSSGPRQPTSWSAGPGVPGPSPELQVYPLALSPQQHPRLSEAGVHG